MIRGLVGLLTKNQTDILAFDVLNPGVLKENENQFEG